MNNKTKSADIRRSLKVAMRARGQSFSMKDLMAMTGETAKDIRIAMQPLKESGNIRTSGANKQTQYRMI